MDLQKDNPTVTAFNQMAQEAEELQAKRFCPRKEKAAEMKTEVKDEKPKYELKPCPFCGKTNLKVMTTGGYDVGYNCRVVCRTEGCYASGIPLGGDPETEEEAVRIWNTRMGVSLDEVETAQVTEIKELKDTRCQLDGERQKFETATGLLRARDEEVLCLKKKIETECDKCPAVNERDELKHQLEMKEEQCKSCAALCALRFQCEDIEKERDELRSKLCEMTKYRDECESQFHAKCEELASTIADFNALKEEHAKFTPKPRLQAKVAELTKENEELKQKLKEDCKECVSQDEAKYLGKRLEAANNVIANILHKVKCNLDNYGGPSAEETFKCIVRTIGAYHENGVLV